MTDKKTLEKWRTPPADALYGRCSNPECDRPRCLDPFATFEQFDVDQDTSVILTYTRPNMDQIVRVNGEDLGIISSEKDRETLFEVLQMKYGDFAEDALLEHLLRRLVMMRTTLH